MRLHPTISLLFSFLFVAAVHAGESSWMFRPGYYTHSPLTGQRVAQYEPERPSYASYDPTYQESGYRHEVIHAGNEWLNIVQSWGQGTAIRPYGEWEFPYRPGATPYGPWGNPQGPWTLPFDSWQNPYGLNRLPYGSPWRPGYGIGGPANNGPWSPMPQPLPAQGSVSPPDAVNMQPPPAPPAPQGQAL